jgi:non-ribosomal peptide synthetase-like protein
VLDPEADRALPAGQLGEIGIAGIGLSRGYLNRPDLTDRAFVPDFLGIPDNPSARIYRTGDLGLIRADGEVEHHGRIDSQVKIRGYRIELAEVESVMLQLPGVGQAVVTAFQPEPGRTELAGYYTIQSGYAGLAASAVYARLRQLLPAYMVPAYLEQVVVIPTLTSGKADRNALPAPSPERRLAGQGQYVPPATPVERMLALTLAKTLGVDRVSVESDFFTDLGANSLLMARFSAALRDSGDQPLVSMKDIYLHPTVRQLAAVASRPARPGPTATGAQVAEGTPRYLLCGLLQFVIFLGCAGLASLALEAAATWIVAARGVPEGACRLLVAGSAGLAILGVAPIVAKWLLIGRWKPVRIHAWSLTYLRFWFVKTLIASNPLARLAVGTPLYSAYLRALGARIGPGVVIFTTHVPVCTDLLTVGAGTVIRKDSYLNGYRARSGVIETGPIRLGARTFVGEQSVVDIDTSLGDGAQLGHSSTLMSGQRVPAGECWHGTPAERAEPGCDYQTVPALRCGRTRRAVYAVARLLVTLAVAGPLAAAAVCIEFAHPALLARLPGASARRLTWAADVDALVAATALVLLLVLGGLLVAASVPRIASRWLRPGPVYPLYGPRYVLQRTVAGLSNLSYLTALFGDSSAIVHYLTLIGYRLTPVEQTGSNFGMMIKHEVPSLSIIGTGTMVSDGLSLLNAEFSDTSFRVLPTAIGARNFVGNGIAYPPGGRTGDNCLIATKAMIPITGPVREGVGLLGSPCFEIPRSVRRDHQFEHLAKGEEFRQRLARKNRHNAGTAAAHLAVRCGYLCGLLLVAFVPVVSIPGPRWTVPLVTMLADLAFTIAYFTLVERAATGFRGLRPMLCSIYEPAFWRHERYWKVPSLAYLQLFNGTPAKGPLLRLLGVRVGRRLFDDGSAIIERTLVSLGDDVTLNAASVLQSHSLEDGTFKSGRITIGSGCTVGTSGFLHYDVILGDGAEIQADAFLMKGECVPPAACWGGNPATEINPSRAG